MGASAAKMAIATQVPGQPAENLISRTMHARMIFIIKVVYYTVLDMILLRSINTIMVQRLL